jgi:hypothetical protein
LEDKDTKKKGGGKRAILFSTTFFFYQHFTMNVWWGLEVVSFLLSLLCLFSLLACISALYFRIGMWGYYNFTAPICPEKKPKLGEIGERKKER